MSYTTDMPMISYENVDKPEHSLILEFNLLDLHMTNEDASEGWFGYGLTILRNGQPLISSRGAIHDNDVRNIENLFMNPAKNGDTYEPLEPDFDLHLVESKTADELLLTCMIDYGNVSTHIYDGAGLGVRIPIEKNECLKFAKALRSERILKTNDTHFSDYESKKLK